MKERSKSLRFKLDTARTGAVSLIRAFFVRFGSAYFGTAAEQRSAVQAEPQRGEPAPGPGVIMPLCT